MEKDTYKTIAAFSEGLFKDKGSRFISMAFPVNRQSDIKPIIDRLRKEHHVARHHCYAWMLGIDRKEWRVIDDGEPSGTAGKPMIGQINSAELTNILIVVIRYFGGTLLGVSGLAHAYRSATADAINNAQLVSRTLQDYYEITFPYISMNDVMKVLKEENTGQKDQHFDTECKIKVNIRVSLAEKILGRLSRIEGLKFEYLETI